MQEPQKGPAAILADAVGEAVRTARSIAEGTTDTTVKAVEGVTDTGKTIADGVVGTVRSAIDGAVEVTKRIGEGVTETTRKVAEGITNVQVPTKVQPVLGLLLDKRDQSSGADKSDHSTTEVSGKVDKSTSDVTGDGASGGSGSGSAGPT